MTIQEAIKSGKRFRRPNMKQHTHGGWFAGENGTAENFHVSPLKYADLLADDWEIEERSVEVTRSKLEKALSNAYAGGLGYRGALLDSLFKELGL